MTHVKCSGYSVNACGLAGLNQTWEGSRVPGSHESWYYKLEITHFRFCVESDTLLGWIPILKEIAGIKYFRKTEGRS